MKFWRLNSPHPPCISYAGVASHVFLAISERTYFHHSTQTRASQLSLNNKQLLLQAVLSIKTILTQGLQSLKLKFFHGPVANARFPQMLFMSIYISQKHVQLLQCNVNAMTVYAPTHFHPHYLRFT